MSESDGRGASSGQPSAQKDRKKEDASGSAHYGVQHERQDRASDALNPRPFQSQYSQLSPQQAQQHEMNSMTSMNSHVNPYNMGQMSSTLPDYSMQQLPLYGQDYSGQRILPGNPMSGAAYPVSPLGQIAYPIGPSYAPQPMFNQYPPQSFGHGILQPASTPHNTYIQYSQHQGLPTVITQGLPYGQQTIPYYYHTDAYGRPAVSPVSYAAPVGHSDPSSSYAARPHVNRRSSHQRMADDNFRGHSGSSGTTGVPRGPPRKPKQSGHALWVGNLPPSASIIALKEHFSQGFKRDIESVFLISKSNCAFVNYKSEEICSKANSTFHDARFGGMRLVCRLRKGSTTATSPPNETTGPHTAADTSKTKLPVESLDQEELVDGYAEITAPAEDESGSHKLEYRYFIVKSLTLEDLEESVRTKVWATQVHNEAALNKAYKTADNVYLIFSANRSGGYYGYARMASPIVQDAGILGPIRRQESVEDTDPPKSIATPSTNNAPRGHIIDDSSRGTIFWEAEYTDDEDDDANSESGEAEAETDSWGKPFRVDWISTVGVPFHRTKGLRNPWNANREVKIARDGTELEPGLGKRLISLFHSE